MVSLFLKSPVFIPKDITMFIVSNLIDHYFKYRLGNADYRKATYKKAYNKELRNDRLGQLILRNLNTLMSEDLSCHQEVMEYLKIDDYQKFFWESDLGFLWYKNSFKTGGNKYFEFVIDRAKIKECKSHLDLGCGWGELSSRMAELPSMERVLGIDISEEIIGQATRAHKASKAKFLRTDIVDMDEHFDMITCLGSLDYILPEMLELTLRKILSLADKEVILVNSLRGIPFEKYVNIQSSIEIKRYDIGYVHPMKFLLDTINKDLNIRFEIVKFGSDSALIHIQKR